MRRLAYIDQLRGAEMFVLRWFLNFIWNVAGNVRAVLQRLWPDNPFQSRKLKIIDGENSVGSTLLRVVFLTLAASLLVIPLSNQTLDILMALSIGGGFALILTTYLCARGKFTFLPLVLIFTGLFRIALNMASTRLILLQGKNFDGEVVQAFGNFVVSNNYVLGILVFLGTVLFQKLHLESVFQSSKKNHQLYQRGRGPSSEFFASMYGAVSFLKLEAVVMVLLTLVNIEVGLISGFLSGQFGSVAEIAETYTFLTIGDGLVFLVSIMLATVSARVALSKESKV